MKNKNFEITVIGGSNSAHVIIPLLYTAGHKLKLLTRSPQKWSEELSVEYQLPDQSIQKRFQGKCSIISDKPRDVIPNSDIVILCLPVFAYRLVLNKIAPFISKDKDVLVGTIYGQGGFNWMMEQIKSKYELNNISYFAFGLIPWIARYKEYGKSGITYGPKAVNVVAVNDTKVFKHYEDSFFYDLCERWFDTGKVMLSENFLSLTLSVDNQIIHTSRMFGLHLKYNGVWQRPEDVPYFYKDYDQLSVNLLIELDNDYSKIREKIKNLYPHKQFSYMLNYLDLERLSYNSDNIDVLSSFVNSKTLTQIKTPVSLSENNDWVVSKTHRFFLDDIYYGICISKWIANILNIDTPTIDDILHWAQTVLDVKLIEDKELVMSKSSMDENLYGLPDYYCKKSIDEILD